MRTIQIERKRGLDPATFARDYLQGIGKPLIVTDATDDWAARTKWTFEFFKAAYGTDRVCPGLGLYSDVVNLTNLSTYIDWLAAPGTDLEGFWMERDGRPVAAPPQQRESPPYVMDPNAFYNHPELFEDIRPMYFVQDWVAALSPSVRQLLESAARRTYWGILMGPEGTLSRLHRDFQHTHSWLAQIRGRKRAILFSPDDSEFLYDGDVEPDRPDFARFELLRRATAYDGILEPGDVLFTPADWWHWVRGLDASITVAHNFFNESNFSAYIDLFIKELPESKQPHH